VIAWKFLSAGAIGPFTGFRWPRPDAGGPGPWVRAPEGAPWERWVFACRPRDLPFWLDEELWRIELDGPIREAEFQVAAPRARLVDKVAAWDAGARLAFGEACALRARDAAARALEEAGQPEAGRLREAAGLAAIQAAAERLAAPGGEIGGYVADAARAARAGRAATSAYVTAVLAARLAGGPHGADAERVWQSEWLVARLGP